MECRGINPTFTTVLPAWWGTFGWFFGVAIGGLVYYALRLGTRQKLAEAA